MFSRAENTFAFIALRASRAELRTRARLRYVRFSGQIRVITGLTRNYLFRGFIWQLANMCVLKAKYRTLNEIIIGLDQVTDPIYPVRTIRIFLGIISLTYPPLSLIDKVYTRNKPHGLQITMYVSSRHEFGYSVKTSICKRQLSLCIRAPWCACSSMCIRAPLGVPALLW